MISLVSIVRDEAPVIDRFLDSALRVCESATIVDTGSTDGTQDRIRARGIEVIEHPFGGFGPSRSVALAAARGDWLLCLDADCTVEIDEGFEPDPAVDAYMVEVGPPGFSYRLPVLLNGWRRWKSVGRVHEYTVMEDDSLGVRASTDKVRLTHHGEGRSSEAKSRRYLALLWQDWVDRVSLPRTAFYIAQTYADLGEVAEARNWYDDRVAMGGWDEEVYVAALRAARLAKWPERRDRLWQAWMLRPARLEAPYALARGLNEHGDHSAAYAVASVPPAPSGDVLFVESAAWDYGLDFERHVAAWWVGRYDESQAVGRALLTRNLPPVIRAAVERNLAFGPRES